MLFLPGFLGNCCCYLVTALVQHGVLQWSQLFIVQEKHQSVLTGTYVLLSVMKEFIFSLYELHSSIHCRILFLNLHADYEVGFVPFGFSIVPVFATFMPTWTTIDLQYIYCLKKQLNIVWYVFEFKCALSFDHDLCWLWTFPYLSLWLVHHR